jgi:hypothetical protein
MITQLSAPIRWLPGCLHHARLDSLVRNSLYLMASTIVTAGLGYVFWAFAAHAFTSREAGIGSAVISLCSMAALLVYLGSSARHVRPGGPCGGERAAMACPVLQFGFVTWPDREQATDLAVSHAATLQSRYARGPDQGEPLDDHNTGTVVPGTTVPVCDLGAG